MKDICVYTEEGGMMTPGCTKDFQYEDKYFTLEIRNFNCPLCGDVAKLEGEDEC